MSLTFGPALRLRSRVEFTAVQQHGRRVASRHLTVLASPNRLGRDRLGIIASRRMGGAVTRNRAKRRIREMFRARGTRTDAAHAPTFDVVVIPRREAATVPFATLDAEFSSALARLRRVTPS